MLKRTLYIRNSAENSIRAWIPGSTRLYIYISGRRVLFMAGGVISRKIFVNIVSR